MFKSTSFIFDGVPSEDYGLMIYFLEDSIDRELALGTDVDVIEDRLPANYSPIHYGTNLNKEMTFPLTIGSVESLSDYEVDAILGWLTGHNTYKYLEYVDGDHYVRYKCFINNVKSVYMNGLAAAFNCDVVCDSQFAYEYPIKQEFQVDDTESVVNFFNRSSYNGYLKPKLDILFANDCNSMSIINESDDNREFKINYFDRIVTEDNTVDYVYDTTLSDVVSQNIEPSEYFSWQEGNLPTGNWNDILYGDDVYVLLPENGNKAQISLDKCVTWKEIELPCTGTFKGCYGAAGFVAIEVEQASQTVIYSQTGVNWTQVTEANSLPVKQKWNSICFAEIDMFSDGYYIAVGESSIGAASLSGLNWRTLDVTLPSGNWNEVAYGNGTAIAISKNTNKIAYASGVTTWKELSLPVTSSWTNLTYGVNGWVIIADTVASTEQKPLCLHSTNGVNWETINMPINSWRDISFSGGNYIAISNNKYGISSNGIDWQINTLPKTLKFMVSSGTESYGVGEGLLISTMLNSVEGSFSFLVSEDNIMSKVIISAKIENMSNANPDFSSNGEVQLYMQDDGTGQPTEFDWIILTNDLRHGLGTAGVQFKATWDAENKTVNIQYICDPSHENVMEALLSVRVNYQLSIITDLGMEDLILSFDNQNQIITSNRESLNPYSYFNMKFFRLLKGNNKLKMKTEGGVAKVVITCEFLRKVGGF